MIYIFIGMCILFVSIILTVWKKETSKLTPDNIWKTESDTKFIILGISSNKNSPHPVHVRVFFDNDYWEDNWALSDSRFSTWVGNKETHPEEFL